MGETQRWAYDSRDNMVSPERCRRGPSLLTSLADRCHGTETRAAIDTTGWIDWSERKQICVSRTGDGSIEPQHYNPDGIVTLLQSWTVTAVLFPEQTTVDTSRHIFTIVSIGHIGKPTPNSTYTSSWLSVDDTLTAVTDPNGNQVSLVYDDSDASAEVMSHGGPEWWERLRCGSVDDWPQKPRAQTA